MGTNTPHSIKNIPNVVSVNRESRKAPRSIVTPLPLDGLLLLFFLELNCRKDFQREGLFSSPSEAGSSDEMEEVGGETDNTGSGDVMNSERPRINQFETSSNNRQIKPIILTAHPNPIFGVADWIINGNMIPPTEPPVVARPIA